MNPTKHLLQTMLALLIAMSLDVLAIDGFAGTEQCESCHQAEFEAWQDSHHDWAMRHASAETVKGDFNNQEITVGGITSRFFTRNGAFYVMTDDADGNITEFEIRYTFGLEPLQQYLVEFPDGRLQALSLAWDSRPEANGGERWFHLYPNETIDHTDELHWTGPQQNWNYMCADCHSTALEKNYDSKQDSFKTTWQEINVACEACHGPAQAHVDREKANPGLETSDIDRGLSVLLHDRQDVTWPTNPENGLPQRSGPESTGQEIQVCAACHSRRGLVAEGREATHEFLNHHVPALLTDGLYFADGQIDDEVYVWGSFMQSKMHASGVTCSDCHDPHSLQLRAPGAAVCAQCHQPQQYATAQHHHHAEDSAGSDCLACHMPEKTYMVVDPRRDHSLRIPRPDQSLLLGTPNACNSCHQDRDVKWAAQVFAEWYPDPPEAFQDWGTAFDQARRSMPQAEVSLMAIIADQDTPDIARATAIQELRNFLSPVSGQLVQQGLADDNALVRLAALRALENVAPENRLAMARPVLRDEVMTVRAEAARLLATVPANAFSPDDLAPLQAALQDYIATQEFNADRSEAQLNLGNLYTDLGDPQKAEKHYRLAIARDKRFAPAYVNLAELYRNQGMSNESIRVMQQGLQVVPDDASLHHALGLALVRGDDTSQALAELAQAASLAPQNPRFIYVYGIALNSTGQPVQAIEVLKQGLVTHPRNRMLLFALATLNRDAGNAGEARRYAEQMLQINPADESALGILQQLDQP